MRYSDLDIVFSSILVLVTRCPAWSSSSVPAFPSDKSYHSVIPRPLGPPMRIDRQSPGSLLPWLPREIKDGDHGRRWFQREVKKDVIHGWCLADLTFWLKMHAYLKEKQKYHPFLDGDCTTRSNWGKP
jgi:hypothetical protein